MRGGEEVFSLALLRKFYCLPSAGVKEKVQPAAIRTLDFRLQTAGFSFLVTALRLEKACPEIPPVLPFSKGGELYGNSRADFTFPINSRTEMKEDFTAFQKTKLLLCGVPVMPGRQHARWGEKVPYIRTAAAQGTMTSKGEDSP